MAEGCAESGATRRHLADRESPCNPAARRRHERVRRVAVGFPTSSTEGSTDHQFPFRGAALPGRPLSNSGVAFLRVHRHQIAEAEVEVHEGGRGLVLLRRSVAADAPRRRSVHAAHDGTGAGCSGHSRPADGRAGALWLVGLARTHRQWSRSLATVAYGQFVCWAGPLAVATKLLVNIGSGGFPFWSRRPL